MKKIANFIKNNIAQLSLTVIMILYFLFFLFTSCKPREIIIDRTVYRVDSTAVWKLQIELSQKTLINQQLTTEIERVRNENISLKNEIYKYEIYYDTSQPTNPDTGKPPISSEITTLAKSELEKSLQEKETIIQELKSELEYLVQMNEDKNIEIEVLKQENKDIKTKASQSFNFKSFLWGVLAGIIINVAAYFAIRRLIRI